MEMTSTHPSTDIAAILETAGVDISRIGEREITGKCPVHIRTVGREDRSPSWSINASTGLWICFSCGARGTLSSLLHELIGDRAISAQQFLINSGLDRLNNPVTKEHHEPIVDRDAFFRFERVSDRRCVAKNLDPDLVHKFGVRWNPTNKSWAIPIISSMGQLQGWQEKKPGWVRNFPVGIKKGHTLFGIERFTGKTAVLVESPLDIIRFASVFSSPRALASFGAHVTFEQMNLLLHVADRVVIAMDNDEAGIESSKKLYKIMSSPRKGLKWWNYGDSSAKDIGDMTDEEIEFGLSNATVVPPWVNDVQR
jgi:Toprim-like/CHC2 zinc finger